MVKEKREPKLIGSTDRVDLPDFGIENLACKVDTGAASSSLHCSRVRFIEKDGKTFIAFRLYKPTFGINTRKEFRFEDFRETVVRSSNGEIDFRYSIRTTVIIFGKKYKTRFTLSYREKMKFPVLLGKRLLKNRFIVDVGQDNLSYNQKRQ